MSKIIDVRLVALNDFNHDTIDDIKDTLNDGEYIKDVKLNNNSMLFIIGKDSSEDISNVKSHSVTNTNKDLATSKQIQYAYMLAKKLGKNISKEVFAQYSKREISKFIKDSIASENNNEDDSSNDSQKSSGSIDLDSYNNRKLTDAQAEFITNYYRAKKLPIPDMSNMTIQTAGELIRSLTK